MKMLPYVETILRAIADLLLVQAKLPDNFDAHNTSQEALRDLGKAKGSEFDSQMYLFELVGLLLSLEHFDKSKAREITKNILSPLAYQLSEIQNQESFTRGNPLMLLQAQELTMAIGSLAKGVFWAIFILNCI